MRKTPEKKKKQHKTPLSLHYLHECVTIIHHTEVLNNKNNKF